MPFTLAHPTAVVPLRRWLPLPALVAGSLAPDLAYFLPLGATGSESHSAMGLVWFCLPVGMGALFIYLLVLRPFALAMLPAGVSARMPPTLARQSGRDTAAALAAVAVGAASHVTWDSFTHSSGAVVRALPLLRREVPLFAFYHPMWFTVLQHASSVIGLTALALLAWRWWYRSAPLAGSADRTPEWVKVLVVLALCAPTVAAGANASLPQVLATDGTFSVLQRALGRAVFAAGTAFLVALFVTSLSWRVWQMASEYRRGCRTRG